MTAQRHDKKVSPNTKEELKEEPTNAVTEADESLRTAITDFSMLYPDISLEANITVDNAKVDAGLFLQDLWISLLENAAETGECKSIWVDMKKEAEGFAIEIADDGKGINPALRESLFDVRRRFGGVSLHTAKEIVDRCAGTISVGDRVPGQHERGSLFKVWLPKHQE